MSANGKEKLIAKIQHFYDTLQNCKGQHQDLAITSNNPQEKEQQRIVGECYGVIGVMFSEVFKEFLYNVESTP
jgi:hypothetical protein